MKKRVSMVQFLRSFPIFCMILFVGQVALTQLPYVPGDGKPSNIKFTTTAPDGRYNTGDIIRLEAEFDDWLGQGSEMKVRLNTGDTVTMTFDPEYAEDLIDPNWGVSGKRNAILGGHDNNESYGVYCILELEGKGGHSENKGKFVLGGGFHNYEEYDVANPTSRTANEGHDMLVVTDHDGKLIQGFGHYNDQTNNPQGFRYEVRWVIETQDGGLLVVGAFTNYGGNANYDYIVKFKFNSTTEKFEIDTNFMNNLTVNNTVPAANNVIPQYVDSWGKPQRAVLQDTDGSIYIAGAFTQVSGQIRRSIAKLSSTGVLDQTFNYFSDYSSTGVTTNVSPGTGLTMSFDPDLEKDGANDLWFGAGSNIYRLSKTTGRPTVDCSTTYNTLSAYGQYNVYDRFTGGPNLGALAITVMPNEDQTDAEGNSGPGGVLVTGRYGTTGGWTCVVAIQDDLTLTPRSKFCLGKQSPDDETGVDLFTGWAVDGAAFMKGKMWIGLHEANRGGDYYNSGTNKNYFEGCLAVLNYDGSMNTQFNNMLANADDTDNTMSDGSSRPDGNYQRDGIGGESGGNGGGGDVISLYVTSDDDLMVGGSYGSIMQYTDNAYATSTASSAKPDDQIITRITFKRAVGYYTVSAEDKVPGLKIVEILDDHTIQGAFGEPSGPISMDNIQSGDEFENNHFVAINMPYAFEEGKFITTWQVSSNNGSITIPTIDNGYDFFVDWGTTKDEDSDGVPDGNIPIITHHTNANMATNPPTYTYPVAGTYTVKITGGIDANSDGFSDGAGFPRIFFNNDGQDDVIVTNGNADKIRSVEQWGDIKWTSMANAFQGCDNLQINAEDTPDLSGVSSLYRMFRDATSVNFDISTWDVSNVTDMEGMFWEATAFNNGDTGNNGAKPLSWGNKTANVENMTGMFYKAESFNQSVNGWDVGKVTNMTSLFERAALFNNGDTGDNASKPINWVWSSDPSVLTSTVGMFLDAAVFNQDVSGFKVDNVTNFSFMFYGARMFDQPINGWNVEKGQKFTSMFHYATAFNQELNNWNTQEATNMADMFHNATAFNQTLSNWSTVKVSDMSRMFFEAENFDQNLENWEITALTIAEEMFIGDSLSITNYDALLNSWGQQVEANTGQQNVKFHGGKSLYCAGEAYRELLIDSGWGDGLAGGDAADNTEPTTGIVDGGSGQPRTDLFFVDDFSVCNGGTASLELTGSETGVSYQLYNKADNSLVGDVVEGTGGAITFAHSPTVETSFYVMATRTSESACEARLIDEITISVDPVSVGGTIAGATTVCSGTNSTTLTLSGHTGDVVQWESSEDSFATAGTAIPNISTSNTATDLTTTTYYRAKIKSGVCSETYSDTVSVIVDPISVGGTIAGATAVCSGTNSTTLTLSGHTGDVVRWESSTDNFATDVTVITNTTVSYDATDLTVTTSYRAVVQSGVCDEAYSLVATVTVDPVSVGGTLAGATTVCSGTNSTTLTLSGHTGDVVRWESSTDNFATDVTAITNTTASYDATDLTITTSYRAVVQSGVCDEAYSSVATVTVDPVSVGGTLAGATTVCSGTNSTTLTLSGHTGDVVRWESSTDNFATDVTAITNTTASYDATDLTITTSYRAVVQSGVCDEAYSSVATVTVDPVSVGGTLAGATTVCSGTNSTTLTLSGHTGDVVRWESSTDNFATDVTAIINTTASYDATDLTITTSYRAVVQSGVCDEAYSLVATVTVDPVSVGGTLAGATTVCSGTSSTTLTLSGHTGDVVRWESSTDNFATDVTAITNTTASYNATDLTVTTSYRAVVQSGVCDEAYSSVATVTVNPVSVGGTIAGATTVCSGTNSTTLTLSGHTGNIVRWESSSDNFASDVTPITNSTVSNDATDLTATTYYRAVVQSGVCSETYSDTVSVIVDPVSVGGTIAGATTVCSGTNSTTLTLSGHTGDVVRWESSTDNFATAGTPITNTTVSNDATDLTSTTSYRAVVQSGVCGETYSSVATLIVESVFAVDDYSSVMAEASITIPVTDNDLGTGLAVSNIVTDPSKGTAAIQGDTAINYAAGTTTGSDSLRYVVENTEGCTDTAWVYISIIDKCIGTHIKPVIDTVAQSGLYTFEGIKPGDDLSVNNHHLINSGGVSFETSDAVAGSAARFDGTGGLINNDAAYMTGAINDLTVGFWMKPDLSALGTGGGLVLYEEGGTSNGIALLLTGTATVPQITVSVYSAAVQDLSFSAPYPTDGNWHHVGLVKQGTNVYLFTDGSIQKHATTVATIDVHGDLGAIGAMGGAFLSYPTQNFGPYKGLMDEFYYSQQVIPYGVLFNYWKCSTSDLFNPMACRPEAIQSSTRGSRIEWYEINLVTGVTTHINDEPGIGSSVGKGINSHGYNTIDGLLYGTSHEVSLYLTAVGLDDNGHYKTKFIAPTEGTNTGDVYNGYLYTRIHSRPLSNPGFYKIDVNPASPTYLEVIQTINVAAQASLIADIAISPYDEYIYTVNRNLSGAPCHVYRYSLDGSVSEDLGLLTFSTNTPDITGDYGFGAMFADNDGFIYLIRNEDGANFRIDIKNTPTFAEYLSIGQSAGANDGSRCALAPMPIDFADAPNAANSATGAGYLTKLGDDGPTHYTDGYNGNTQTANLMLGAHVDIDLNGVDTSRVAKGDDVIGVNGEQIVFFDDEDAVGDLNLNAIDTVFRIKAGVSSIASITTAKVLAWIDINGNGLFENTECTIAAVPAGMSAAAGDSVELVWREKPGEYFRITSDSTYLRLRITTDPKVITDSLSTGGAIDGEVEDHLITVNNSLDFGDAPAQYGTYADDFGAVHTVLAENINVYIGDIAPDAESDGEPNSTATGDDDKGVDDEDGLPGISFETDLSNVVLHDIPVVNNTGNAGYLCGWIDVNGDGDFNTGERAVANIAVGFDGTVNLSFEDFNYAIKPGNYYVRLRAGTALAEVNQSTGLASDGEVEDHMICIYPDTILVDDAHMQICEGASSVNLDNCIQYVPQTGKTIQWITANGDAISNGAAFDASTFNAGDIKELHYAVVETFCDDVDVDGAGKLYLEIQNEIDIADKTVTFCKSDAESINLNTVLGALVPGTWEALTAGADAQLNQNRFNGAAMYNDTTGGDQSFVFRFTADTGTCMVNSPVTITVVITDDF